MVAREENGVFFTGEENDDVGEGSA